MKAIALCVLLLAACRSDSRSEPGKPAEPSPTASGGGSSAQPPAPKKGCETVRVQMDGAKAFQLAAHAEYCLMTPNPVECCRKEGANCDVFAGSAAPVFDVVRNPGCPAPADNN